jgi:hypothetical protein
MFAPTSKLDSRSDASLGPEGTHTDRGDLAADLGANCDLKRSRLAAKPLPARL